MLIAARALLSPEPLVELGGLRGAIARRRAGFTGILARRQRPLRLGLAVAFLGAAAASSVLALVNGPVGPATYSPALTELRPALGRDSTVVLASQRMLDEEHGRDYLVWELRGGRVCVEATARRPRRAARRTAPRSDHPGPGRRPPFAGLRLARRAGPYVLWRTGRRRGPRDLCADRGRWAGGPGCLDDRFQMSVVRGSAEPPGLGRGGAPRPGRSCPCGEWRRYPSIGRLCSPRGPKPSTRDAGHAVGALPRR